MNVYVLTNEGKQQIFDLWELLPKSDDIKSWKTLEYNKVQEFETMFKRLKSVNMKVNLLVELLITNADKPFLKLYDTVF